MPGSGEQRVDASPTKGFFIQMLVKDISLTRAIVDLVDNSVDGAIRLRGRDGGFHDLWVRIEIPETGELFRISDNCGGIPFEDALNYAFRFGRPDEFTPTPHSIGQFGVGMKRAIFKLGKHFKVTSRTPQIQFCVEDDVDEWSRRAEWEFPLYVIGREHLNPDECGTSIEVTRLEEGVAQQFRLELFHNSLWASLRSAHEINLQRGLDIIFNGRPLGFDPSGILVSDDLKPATRMLEMKDGKVKVTIIAGLGTSDPKKAGWNVYCNGRLVLEADKTVVSGWGDTVPQFHSQYNRFRGYVFFDSEEGHLLPWNTTKTGVDFDSPMYRAVRSEMIVMMRPVVDFINRVDREKERDEEEHYLHQIIESAKPVRTADIRPRVQQTFYFAERPTSAPPPATRRISYEKPADEVDKVKEKLGVRTLREVGERTFEYYLKYECDE